MMSEWNTPLCKSFHITSQIIIIMACVRTIDRHICTYRQSIQHCGNVGFWIDLMWIRDWLASFQEKFVEIHTKLVRGFQNKLNFHFICYLFFFFRFNVSDEYFSLMIMMSVQLYFTKISHLFAFWNHYSWVYIFRIRTCSNLSITI